MKLIAHYFVPTLLLITCTNSLSIASANTQVSTPKPETCPSAASLQTLRIQLSDLIEVKPSRTECCTANGFPYHVNGTWSTRNFIGQYGTNHQWSISLYEFDANTAEDALKKANQILASLNFAYGPSYYFGHWGCTYHSSDRDVGVDYLNS